MTSDLHPGTAFVWIWLPGKTEPVVAGRIDRNGPRISFTYGASYLAREDAIPIYDPELPLRKGTQTPLRGLEMPSCIRDGSPDAWGRRVIINKLTGKKPGDPDVPDIGEIAFLLGSGTDRIGALDFQVSAKAHVPRETAEADLSELMEAAPLVEQGVPLTPGLDIALNHGTSIGGARPKALISDGDRKLIAKFSSGTDTYGVVHAEFLAMRLARACGLNVAPVEMRRTAGKDVILIERFDRRRVKQGWERRAMVSALTILGLDEMEARYASYEDLAETIRHRFREPKATLRELYGRICFSILCGNTDDHARNHAAFWDGSQLELTPAYDICPQPRTGGEASQAMLISGSTRASRIADLLSSAPAFQLGAEEAEALVIGQLETIGAAWTEVCDAAGMSVVDRRFLAGRQFLNAFSLYGSEDRQGIASAFGSARDAILMASA